MPKYELYTDDLKPKPMQVQGFGFKVPEKLKDTDARFQKAEIKLGLRDYLRLINRYLVNQFAGVMNLEVSENQPTGWVDIIADAVKLLFKLIKKLVGK